MYAVKGSQYTMEEACNNSADGSVYTEKGPRRWLELFGDCPLMTTVLNKWLGNAVSPLARIFILCIHFLDCTGRNIGQVCFANNPISGFLMLLGFGIAMPEVAASTFLASTVAIFAALVFRISASHISAGLSGYNAALLGAVMPALLLGPGSNVTSGTAFWLAVLIGAIFTVVISSSLRNSLGSLKPAIPIFTIPFNLVTMFLIIVLRVYSPAANVTTASDAPELSWQKTLQGSVLGAGQVFALQDWWSSGLVLFGMAICSPLLTLAGYMGSLVGTVFAVLVNPSLYEASYAGIYGYNGFLSACLICFFFVPTWRSLLLGVINSLLATTIQIALAWALYGSGLPVLTFPFVISSSLIFGLTSNVLPRPQTELTFPEKHCLHWKRNAMQNI